jgi:serine protease SohB
VAEFVADYGLFLAEVVTLAALVLIVVLLVIANARRGGDREGLTIKHLNEQMEQTAKQLKRVLLPKDEFKRAAKAAAKVRKERKRGGAKDAQRKRLFVVDFKGDLRASATASLREEISAILGVAEDGDEVLVRLENAGGTVHEHGLAASQLLRLKARKVRLLVAVDKVAASGGYLMACVADRLMSAPFAIVGSIGVLAQLPNFHRLLEEKGVDFEMITAGRFKRTLTYFGANTDEGRQKLKQELEDVHALFKAQVAAARPQVDIEAVATGEHWYGTQALELKLVDELRTSDDFLLEAAAERDLYHVAYKRRRPFTERLLGGVESFLGPSAP